MHTAHPAGNPPTGAAPAPASILVVEDSMTQAFALKMLLEKDRYRVHIVENGQEALRSISENRPDMVISDIDMPELDGYGMCHAIKSRPETQSIPVILLTTLSDPEHILQGLGSKADYYLTKPYDPQFLLDRVRAALDHQAACPADDEEGGFVVSLGGRQHRVHAEPRQMLSLLLSTYDNAIQQYRVLVRTQQELNIRNQQLREQSSKLQEQQQLLEEANAKLQALATEDGLTGLKNHRAFKEELERQFQSSTATHAPLSVILLDVDRFKAYNDSFGHPEGDDVLRRIAKTLTASTRSEDYVARYGGEEFVILLPGADRSTASTVAERIRRSIEHAPWKQRQVTASLGVSTRTASNSDASTLLTEADQALYSSKQSGRNRVTHYFMLQRSKMYS